MAQYEDLTRVACGRMMWAYDQMKTGRGRIHMGNLGQSQNEEKETED